LPNYKIETTELHFQNCQVLPNSPTQDLTLLQALPLEV